MCHPSRRRSVLRSERALRTTRFLRADTVPLSCPTHACLVCTASKYCSCLTTATHAPLLYVSCRVFIVHAATCPRCAFTTRRRASSTRARRPAGAPSPWPALPSPPQTAPEHCAPTDCTMPMRTAMPCEPDCNMHVCSAACELHGCGERKGGRTGLVASMRLQSFDQ
eukprot:5363571-Pleurochrysis_carterae.AAC.1